MRPLRIGVLTSRQAPGLEQLLADPNRGATWDLAIVAGSESTLASQRSLESAGVPVELRPIRQMVAFRNLRERERYDRELSELLLRMDVDYVLLCGYDYILTEALLAEFPERVLALHDSDLSLRANGRCYPGIHPVRDAILAGEPETRSSIYVVTHEIARGPLFLLSGPHPVAGMALDARERGNADFLIAYAGLHRTWMHMSSGALLARTLELLSGGCSKVVGDIVWIDGAPGPCRMGEAPPSCHEPEAMIARGIPRSCPFIDGNRSTYCKARAAAVPDF